MAGPVQFCPFSTFVHPSFWSKLSELKLEVYALDESTKDIAGFYVNSDAPGLSSRFTVDFNGFEGKAAAPTNSFACDGALLLTNTIESFRDMDRQSLLKMAAKEIWERITCGACLQDEKLLTKFVFTCFANLKKYHYHYWMAFPALLYPKNINLKSEITHLESAGNNFGAKLNELLLNYSEFTQKAAFLIVIPNDNLDEMQLISFERIKENFGSSKVILVVCDPCTSGVPGWPVRNYLAAWAYYRPNVTECDVLCLRRRYVDGKIMCGHSLYFTVEYCREELNDVPGAVGWARNEKKMLAPQVVDMSLTLDPIKVASSSVNLNLQLMRWRLVPEMDLECMQSQKCLIFGAGTLGCNVARMLLAWGVRHITFVDNATVSYSNPVRQTLYKFTDSVKGGKKKAMTAAQAVLEIVPSAAVTGLDMTVPMPGHTVLDTDVNTFESLVGELDSLVRTHDVVFMLLDSREGRWLPALLAAVHDKIAMSIALGFDSYVILRHGCRTAVAPQAAPSCTIQQHIGSVVGGAQLGCYFCNDVTAPGNSVRDRTLDQQCTVTRPGVSMVAAGMGVELLASLVQHPLQGGAPAVIGVADDDLPDDVCSCLGAIPHQIRGYISRFTQITPCVQRFHSCIACSDQVLDMYRTQGHKFILEVCNNPGVLEKTTGLAELQATTDLMEVWELSDTESVKSMDSNM